MKMILVMSVAVGSMLAQSAPSTAPPPAAKSTAKSKKPAKAATPPLTIPKEAVDQGDGSFRYVDKKGTPWIYRQTPFGVSRSLESTVLGANPGQTPFGQSKGQAAPSVTTASANASEDPNEKATAVAKGDMIEFSRPTPFGITKWQKSKNDLTPDEQKIWSRVQPKGNE